MISKQQIKFINSLHYSKYRLKHNCFIAEGVHVVNDFIQSDFIVKNIFSTKEYDEVINTKSIIIPKHELSKISVLKNPSSVLAVINKPTWSYDLNNLINTNKIIILDSISDPGNMGAIIRTADWYGIKDVYISNNCVDVFSPKVVQSTMGSLCRVRVYNVDLQKILKDLKQLSIPCYGATLSGKSIYKIKKPSVCALVFGSESHGINPALLDYLDEQITIPTQNNLIDSLNVSVAFGIILSEFR